MTPAGSPAVEDGLPITESRAVRVPVVLRNPLGLHMRPAAAFAKAAAKFQADVKVFKGTRAANGKSFTNLLMLAAGPGTELILQADGPDAEDAVRALADLLGSPSPDGVDGVGH